MSIIKSIGALEILDSRGNPTVEVQVETDDGYFVASVPSGASTGIHEAVELRDGGKKYGGKGVKKAIKNIEQKIFPLLNGVSVFNQHEIDLLLKELDGTDNKKKLGANAILAVSLACARAGAQAHNLNLYEYIHQLMDLDSEFVMPRGFFNVINGGRHAGNKLQFQEFMICPKGRRFTDRLRIASEVYHVLKGVIAKKYGPGATSVGDEGGFAPPLEKPEDALKLLIKAIDKAGYTGKVGIAMDVAASEFYHPSEEGGCYHMHKSFDAEGLKKYYLKLIKKYKIISIEDPFHQDDFEAFALLLKDAKKLGCQVVGDDLTVTNVKRVKKAVDLDSCNCLLLKVNQIGTLSEALDAVKLAYKSGWKVMVSHRSGETSDSFIADLVVGISSGQIKSGAPCRGERVEKYNQLLRVEQVLLDEI